VPACNKAFTEFTEDEAFVLVFGKIWHKSKSMDVQVCILHIGIALILQLIMCGYNEHNE